MRDLTCTEVTDSAPGYALDILDAPTRDRVAAHLLRCPGCRVTVTEMQGSAAELLDLRRPGDARQPLPNREGPDWRGWSEWSYEEPGDLPPARTSRRRIRMALSLAAAALLIVGSSLGPEIEQLASSPEPPTATMYLTADGTQVGTVRLYTGRLQAMDIDIRHLSSSGSLDVVVVDRNGVASTVGRVDVEHSRGAWLGQEPLTLEVLATVLLVGSDRHAVASASLASSV